MKHLVSFLVLWIAARSLFGQPFTHYNYSIPEGLPSSEVYEVFQDSHGFLWFATDNGVVKYDGLEFHTYHTIDSLSHPVVFGFAEDHQRRIWFRTYSGKLSYYDNGKIHSYKYNHVIGAELYPRSLIYGLKLDEDGTLWLTGSNLLARITKDGEYKEIPRSGDGIFIEKVEDEYLIGEFGWLQFSQIHFLGHTFSFDPIDFSRGMFLRVINWKGQAWVSFNSTLFRVTESGIEKVYSSDKIIISLSTDSDNNLWIGYMGGGVEKFQTDDFKNPGTLDFLSKKSVTKVLKDQEGGFWITTLESGVYYIPNVAITNYNFDIPSKIRAIKPFGGNVLVGDQSGSVYSIDFKKGIKQPIEFFNSSVLTMHIDRLGNYWVGTNNNSYLYDKDFHRIKVLAIPFPNATSVSNSFADAGTDGMWSQGSNRIRKYSLAGDYLISKPVTEIFRSIFADDSLLYMAGRTGLFVRDQELNPLEIPDHFKNYKITSVLPVDDRHLVLITQGNGFILMNKKNWQYTQYDSRNRFFANNIYSSLKTDSALYLGTEKGLVKVDLASLIRNEPTFQTLYNKSGLSGEKIDFLMNIDKSLLVVTEDGISIIPLNEFDKTVTPAFYVKAITVNQSRIDTLESMQFDYFQNNVQVMFGFISYKANENIIVRFRLSPDQDWTYTTNRSIDFYSMSPGDYSLDLQYTTDNSNWTDGLKGVPFSIRAPWWKLWYYQMIPVIALLAFAFIFLRSRFLLIQQREHTLKMITQNQQKLIQAEIVVAEKERSRIAKDLHDSVGTNMVATKMLIGQLLRKHHEPMAEQVEEQLQTIIQEIKEIIYNLAPPGVERYGLFTILKDLVKRLSKSTTIEIIVNTYGNDIKNSALTTVVLRVVQELLVNSFKHSSATNINLDVSVFEDRLNLIYEDDGIGFSPTSTTRGSGLDNIETRLKSINGQIKFESGDFGISYNIDIPLTPKK